MSILLVLLLGLVKAGVVIGAILSVVPGLIYLERKICAYVQGRLGPNRVNLVVPLGLGPLGGMRLIPGSLQPLADGIKLAFKEEIIPRDADKLLWYLGPLVSFLPVICALAFLPFGTPHWELFGVNIDLRVAPVSIGVLMLFAVSSLAIYGIAVGGWGSGSKYPLMAAVRASAQMISYEVAMGLAIVAAIASLGAVDVQEMVLRQATTDFLGVLPGWLIFSQPLAALIFMVAMFAENNRLPFDLPEAEPELVGGYHTEYSGLKFGLFFLGEYAAMCLMCGLFTTLFLGGWSLPWVIDPLSTGTINALLSMAVFGGKVMALLLFQIWIRWTLPRFRYDQLMHLGWKVMVPLALANLVVTAFVLTFTGGPAS